MENGHVTFAHGESKGAFAGKLLRFGQATEMFHPQAIWGLGESSTPSLGRVKRSCSWYPPPTASAGCRPSCPKATPSLLPLLSLTLFGLTATLFRSQERSRMKERTLSIVKPDAVKKHVIG